MINKRVILLGDDSAYFRELQRHLQENVTDVCRALSDAEALELFVRQSCCLVIIEAPLDGYDVFGMIRCFHSCESVPILVLGDEITAEERVLLMQTGATVCFEKQKGVNECIEQAKVLIKLYVSKMNEPSLKALTFGPGLVIDPVYRLVMLNGSMLDLTRREFDLLYYLASHNQQVLSREQIYNSVWGENSDFLVDDTVKSCIKSLRKKLASSGQAYIQNVRGVGYRFAYNRRV